LARRFADDGATVSIGAHSGSCVCGEAGGARNRMFSVVGDAVNVSRRILDTAEARRAAIVCSDDVVGLARLSDDERRKLTDLGTVNFRGRDSGLHLWSIAP
jgi:class 3 adenylate cyclase